jgi:hypothetical protein
MKCFSLLVVLASSSFVLAADLRVFPPDISLSGLRSQQQLLVFESGSLTADRTESAKYVSANPKVATVDTSGVVLPVADGETTISVQVAEQAATVKVRVVGMQDKSPPSFRNEVLPILTRTGCNSGACHGALAGKGGFKLSLRAYDPETDHHVMTRQALCRRVDRLEPEKSLLILKGTRAIPHGGGTKMEKGSWHAEVLKEWIAGGAQGTSEKDTQVAQLEIYPPIATVKPQDKLRVIVRARYSDNRLVDVTRLVKFVSSESQVADVDEEGRINVAGYGEAAISAVFDNRVATAMITSPFPNRIDSTVFAKSPRNGFIDERILSKLEQLRLKPAETSSDGEFIRRAYLDAVGILPTPQEVAAFVNDATPNKRAKLIDHLLERPEFVDYWSYKWSDLFLVSTHKLPQPAMWSFYRYLRQSVADNKPWDQFASDLLTSNGSNLQRGGGNFFVLHKDVAELTESTAVTFLGMSITCARCHNHPLEKWTQDQYWSMANMFSRVGLKNGDRVGEVIVQSNVQGNILHPRRLVPMPPTPLDGKPIPLDAPSDRRDHFVAWLTAPDNPYFAKAIVNRVWKNFMGRGLVEAEDDLRETNPASNRELFDDLSKDFIAHRFDVKYLIRQIMNSAAYQRSSKSAPGSEGDDRFYSRYLVRRLSGEVILDALSQVSGAPTLYNRIYTGVEGGTATTANYPEGLRALQLPDSRVASRFLDAFGRPDRQQVCSCERQQDSTVSQALMLNNGESLNEKLKSSKSFVTLWLKDSLNDTKVIEKLFALALSRQPTPSELTKMTALLKEYGNEPAQRREALEDLFWAVLTSREFLFNH